MLSLKASLCVLLSALGVIGSPITTRQEQSRILVEPALFEDLQRYTIFSAASLATFIFGGRKCPNPPFGAPVVALIDSGPLPDTQAAVFRADDRKEIILSFVGSSSIQDFIVDFSFIPIMNDVCTGCQAHAGFLIAWRAVKDKTISILKEQIAKNPGYDIVVVGHSLGGALAGLAYPELKAEGLPIRSAYTMGQPRVGNQAFADYVDQISGATESSIVQFFRITHNTDGVPSLPSRDMGFQHSRTEFFELDNASGNQTAETTFRCFGQEAAGCNLGAAMGFINQDHLEYTGINVASGKVCGVNVGLPDS